MSETTTGTYRPWGGARWIQRIMRPYLAQKYGLIAKLKHLQITPDAILKQSYSISEEYTPVRTHNN